eukprot:TRINITY_DN27218_c0_g1_i1.p1 TRINITY_DN27218_c0_g1~~TRINITY_DN27218_c0_g1_i1.p1  ORF type:complete len:129 (+),score=2.23 TRINITY_DN27218_c0_g1_i1:1-387(+)
MDNCEELMPEYLQFVKVSDCSSAHRTRHQCSNCKMIHQCSSVEAPLLRLHIISAHQLSHQCSAPTSSDLSAFIILKCPLAETLLLQKMYRKLMHLLLCVAFYVDSDYLLLSIALTSGQEQHKCRMCCV